MKQISALQEKNLWNIMTRNIPTTAVADWVGHYRQMSMGSTSLDNTDRFNGNSSLFDMNKDIMGTLFSNQQDRQRKIFADEYIGRANAYTARQNELIEQDRNAARRRNMTWELYCNALDRGDLAAAQSLSALNPEIRASWNARVRDRQQTQIVKEMLGKDATKTYMTEAERTLFYNRFIKGNKNEADRKYNEYLIYMYLYGCAVHAILNSLLHAKGQALTDNQYKTFLQAVYDNAADIFMNNTNKLSSFTKNDFGKSFEIKNGVVPLKSGDNIILKDNVSAAKKIRDILHNQIGIDMSDIYVSDIAIPDGYAVTAEGAGDNSHKVAIDTVTKAWFDSLKGRNTNPAENQERLWIGTTVGGGQ